MFSVSKVQLRSSASRGGSGLDALHSGVLAVSAVVDTESGVRAAEDGRLSAGASQLVQPDLTRPCRRKEGWDRHSLSRTDNGISKSKNKIPGWPPGG